MAKQANTMMIGSFVVIAFFLLAASVVILGSGKLFKHTETFVLYFDSAISGLNVGAPVLIQGVQVGAVTKIEIRTNRQNLTMNIPVYIEINQDRFQVEDIGHARVDPAETIAELSKRGLRAVLSMQSFITGQLMIELGYYPDTPINLKNLTADYPEIPTIPSTTDRLYQTLQKIDFVGLADNLQNTMNGVDKLVNNPDLSAGLKALRQTADESRELVKKLDRRVDEVFDAVDNTLNDAGMLVTDAQGQVELVAGDLRTLIEHFDELALTINKQIEVVAGTADKQMNSVAGNLNEQMNSVAGNLNKQMNSVADNLNETLSGVSGVISEDAPLVIQLEETLRRIAAMTDSIRQLADYLEQHPESLLRGK